MLEPIILITVLCLGAMLGIPLGWWMRSHEQKRLNREKQEALVRIKRTKRLRAGREHQPREGAGPPIKVHRIRIRRR